MPQMTSDFFVLSELKNIYREIFEPPFGILVVLCLPQKRLDPLVLTIGPLHFRHPVNEATVARTLITRN